MDKHFNILGKKQTFRQWAQENHYRESWIAYYEAEQAKQNAELSKDEIDSRKEQEDLAWEILQEIMHEENLENFDPHCQ